MKKNDVAKRHDHEILRNKAAIFDFTHGRIQISGPDACTFLDGLNTNYITTMKPGRAIYTAMLDETGYYIDDILIYCIDATTFQVVTARPDMLLAWMQSHVGTKDVTFDNLSAQYSMWNVQGPESRRILLSFLEKDLADMPYFSFADNKFGDINVVVSRTGFTGELGYEVFVDNKDVKEFLVAFEKAGKAFGAEVIGKDVCLESIPGEKGLLRLRDFAFTNPLELDMGWMIRWDKEFLGKAALQKIKTEGAARKLKGFIVENDEIDIVNESPVKCNGVVVGKVTCANYGYTVEKSIGYCLIESKCAADGTPIIIESEGKEYKATVVARMFYDAERAKVLS